MTEHFLTYEQSLAVKELGFDEHCLQTSWDFDITNKVNIPLPLKGQFFKWVREKHDDIDFFIKKDKSDHVWYIYEIYFKRLADGEKPPVMVGYKINSWLGLNLEFNTYEQAEDACIDKIIEILKLK